MPAGVAHHALGAAGGAGGVEDVERVGGGDGDRVHRFRGGDQFLPVEIARAQFGGRGLALEHHDVLGLVGGGLQRLVDDLLVVDDPGRFDAAGRRDDRLGAGVVDPGGEFPGGEAAEHHGVHGADPRAGEHADDRLGDHRHVDDHPVPSGDPERGQRAREPRDGVAQFGVGVRRLGAGDRGVVEDGRLVSPPGGDMAVEGVVRGVELAVGEPPVQRRPGVVQGPGGRARPVDCLGGLQPESLPVGQTAPVHLGVRPHEALLATLRLPYPTTPGARPECELYPSGDVEPNAPRVRAHWGRRPGQSSRRMSPRTR